MKLTEILLKLIDSFADEPRLLVFGLIVFTVLSFTETFITFDRDEFVVYAKFSFFLERRVLGAALAVVHHDCLNKAAARRDEL